ncbi:MAG: glycosyl hydrolase family 28-related protein [Flectobacillus sp.]|uniref:glycosyl hydrolase family 28-related protein n=1 Tax=Flectobacillus sp. TaxID=50419 RepID=UPI003B9B4F18
MSNRLLTIENGKQKAGIPVNQIFKLMTVEELRSFSSNIEQNEAIFVPELATYLYPSVVPQEDDGYTCIVTESGQSLVRQDFEIRPEIFGAKGDGETDDTLAINRAINFVYSKYGKGAVKFRPVKYNVEYIQIRSGVNLIGSDMYPNSASTSESGTIISCISEEFLENMVSFIPDNTFQVQLGEKTNLAKSQPRSLLSNIQFQGDGRVKHVATISESWGFALYRCKFHEAISYSLKVFDCNNFYISKCEIRNFLFTSNADYNVDGNEISGTSSLAALVIDRSAYGIITQNKIYFSPAFSTARNFEVSNINGELIEFVNQINLLTNDPKYFISGSANGFLVDNQTGFTLKGVNKNSSRVVTTRGVLSLFSEYNLRGTLLLDATSTSDSRVVRLTCGNETQTYATYTIYKGIPFDINLNFFFNPAGYKKTGPLKLIFESVANIVTDDFTVSNLVIRGNLDKELDETPVIVDYLSNSLSIENINKLPHSEPYYIKFIDSTHFKLAKTPYDFANNIFINFGNITPVGLKVSVPSAVVAMLGKQSADNVFSVNKIEDVESTGILIVGAYNNSITANKISKSNFVDGCTLVNVTKGATKNLIDANIINRRFEVSALDKTSKSIVFDKYSGKNTVGVNKIGDSLEIDIQDNFEGTSDCQNQYANVVLENAFIYRKKPISESRSPKGFVFPKGVSCEVKSSSPLITQDEWTVFFEGLYFDDNDGDTVLFKQDGGGSNGRINIKRFGSSNSIIVTVNTTVVVVSSVNTIVNKRTYDVLVCKDIAGFYSIYIDGELVQRTQEIALPTPVSAGVYSYLGTTNASKWSIERFRCFNDCLTEKEIYTLFCGKLLEKNVSQNTKLLDSISGTNIFSSQNNAIAVTQATGGVLNDDCIKIDYGQNNKLPLNLSINESARLTFYAKSDMADLAVIFHGDITYCQPIGTQYKKYVIYLEKNGRLITAKAPTLQFAKQTVGDFGGNFSSDMAGVAYLDTLKIFKGIPCVADLDFTTLSTNPTTIKNKVYTPTNGLLESLQMYYCVLEKAFVTTFNADGVNTIFSVPHGLGYTPSVITGNPQSTSAMGIYCCYADATNLYLKYQTAPTAGTLYFSFRTTK